MKIPIFLSILLTFILWLQYQIYKSNRITKQKSSKFWDKERNANLSRRKDISNLSYLHIPHNLLQLPETIDEDIKYYYSIIIDLSNKKILDLSSYTNTDLKLNFGVANLTILSEYDSNYILLVSTIQKLAQKLFENQDYHIAMNLLEFSLFECQSKMHNSALLLAKIYRILSINSKLDQLISQVNEFDIPKSSSFFKDLDRICILPVEDIYHI